METGAQKLEQPWKSVSDSFSQKRVSDKDIFYGAAIGEKMSVPGSAGEVNVTILYDTGDYDNENTKCLRHDLPAQEAPNTSRK
ncbi:hypothetical protein N7481_013342 [Penicillium waksmanii]|uniref:uncharacterized protein n=1 Tax=Penicillium waksmanii TaxID=69791 RepID=UPI0025499F36|nr:uncharacterized protein N7481_013342 [Penicillium waksmanii]KAJ5966628.1 hypothetical protein N7481_013342 [Penicillium waksmanii]